MEKSTRVEDLNGGKGALGFYGLMVRIVCFGALKWSRTNTQGKIARGDHM